MRLREAETAELGAETLASIRRLMDAAFEGDFADEDLDHALGGRHWLIEAADGRVVAHASVVERAIEVAGVPLRTGYVEAVGTAPADQRRGLGTRVVAGASRFIRERYQLGCLGTGEWAFYERLGWERWQGSTFVRLPDGRVARTAEDDDGIMILRTPQTPPLDLRAPISCEWRPGDAW
jgi:aminoglycoside 2'-N-acetyltransferase I